MRLAAFALVALLTACGKDEPPFVPPPVVEQPLPPVPTPEPPAPQPEPPPPTPEPVPEPIPVPVPVPTCEGVPKPAPEIITDYYADGTSADFIYDGELRAIGEGPESEELVMLPGTGGIPPNCWAWQWRNVQ